MRILFVHEVNWRSKIVFEMHDLPELLSLRGHECVFIDFAEGRRPTGLRRLLDLHTEVTPDLARAHPGARVELRTPGRVFAPPLDRLAASLTQCPELWKTIRDGRFDAMFLYAVPTNGWQALRIAHHFGLPVLFRAIDISHMLRKTIFGPLIYRAEQYILRNADAVSANNEALRRYCVGMGAPKARTSTEYPGLDLERFAPGPRDPELCRKYGLEPHHKVTMFMGTFYRFAGLEWFIEQFAPVLRRRPEMRLLLIGGGEEDAALRAQAARLGLEGSIIFTGFIDYPRLADHLRLADVAFNTFRRSLVTDCALPSKVIQYLGCGLPSVCTPLDGLQAMLPEEQGTVYRELGPEFIGEIEALLVDDARRGEMARAGRATIERLCRWENCLPTFERALERAIENRRSGQA